MTNNLPNQQPTPTKWDKAVQTVIKEEIDKLYRVGVMCDGLIWDAMQRVALATLESVTANHGHLQNCCTDTHPTTDIHCGLTHGHEGMHQNAYLTPQWETKP